jgi:hypothetical protein
MIYVPIRDVMKVSRGLVMADVQVTEVRVPDAVANLRLLDRVDYHDAYVVHVESPRQPDVLLRDFLEGAPPWFVLPWAHVLGHGLLGKPVDLSPRPDRVVGWDVVADSPGAFAVALDTPRGLAARIIAVTAPGQEVIATQIKLSSKFARSLFPAIRRGHRFFAPFLLRRSAARASAAR